MAGDDVEKGTTGSRKRMEFAQDAAGWKSIIFLPFSVLWQVVVMITVFYVFMVTTIMVTFEIYVEVIIYTILFCDFIYIVDVVCCVLHISLTNTRKLRTYLPKSPLLVTLDCISLIPLDLIYMAVIWAEEGHEYQIRAYLLLNRELRVYRFYYYFRQIHFKILSIESGYIISYLELIVYAFLLSHISSCLFFFLKDDEEFDRCDNQLLQCIVMNEMEIYSVICHRFLGDSTVFDTVWKRVAVGLFSTGGFMYFYGFMAPMFVFSCLKRLKTFFEFLNRFKRLRIFLNNLIEDPNLKKKALNEFQVVWSHGKGDVPPELLKNYPPNLIKNAYCDMYWDAFRHSDLLKNISYGCKRSLSKYIIGDFFTQDTILWEQDQRKNCLIYVASGIVQVMAEENSKSPILSFSGGTILGEVSMFYPTATKAIVRVATFSELYIIPAKNFFRVIQDYPNDRKIIRRSLGLRFLIARTTNVRKRYISKVIFRKNEDEVGDFTVTDDDSVKWIKTQHRIITDMHKDLLEGKSMHYISSQTSKLKTNLNHTSVYLPLLNLSEKIEVLQDVTCIKTSIPWVMDPNSHFIGLWKRLILVPVVFNTIVYPVYIGWSDEVPAWLITFSQVTTFTYFVDVIVQLSTAVKTKTGLIVDSGSIVINRLKKFSFYTDVLTALPLQLIISNNDPYFGDAFLRVCISVNLLKIYRLVGFLNDWCENIWGLFRFRIMFKYLLYYLLILYWSAALFHTLDVACIFKQCRPGRWFKEEFELQYPAYHNLASVYFSIDLLGGVPSNDEYEHNMPSILWVFCALQVVQYVFLVWTADFISAYMLESSQEVKFKFLLQSALNFANMRRIIGRMKKRLHDMMIFNWFYDRGDYITQKRAMLEDAPVTLKEEVNRATIFGYLQQTEILKNECDGFIWRLCEKSHRLALPANSILVTFGVQTMTFYLVYKGYLQVNSFLPRDVVDSMAAAQQFGPGKLLPLIIVLNQMPSAVTARTLTDTELIVIRLEDFITNCITYECFKDFVDAIMSIDLKPFAEAKLSLSKVPEVGARKLDNYYEPFRKCGCVGWIVSKLLLRRTINNNGKLYLAWELFRLACLITSAIFWPLVFIVPYQHSRQFLVGFLLGLDVLSIIDLYIKMHVSFYNNKGIKVTHSLITAIHYMHTSMFLDSLFIIPFSHCLVIATTDSAFAVDHGPAVFHSIIRTISLYRLLVYIRYQEHVGAAVIKSCGYCIICMIIFHVFIVMHMLYDIEWIIDEDGKKRMHYEQDTWIGSLNIEGELGAAERYLLISYIVCMMIFRSYPVFSDYSISNLMHLLIFSTVGLILTLVSYGFFISRKTGSRLNFTIYQFHMKNFKHFLKTEKADDIITTMAIKHFEHEWEKKKGDDLHSLFNRLPEILHEDLLFPVYRKTLTGLPCFTRANEGFYRTLSRKFREVYLRMGSVVIFEMGVYNEIYFIHTGLCKVGNTVLPTGSMVGDIKRKGIMQNTVYALTHVVLLSITSTEFYRVLNNFYETEQAYMREIEHVEDYMQSDTEYVWVDVEQEKKRHEGHFEEQSSFEPEDEMRAKMSESAHHQERKKITVAIHPDSTVNQIFYWIFILDALITCMMVPMFISLRLQKVFEFFSALYILDGIWLIKIFMGSRTCYYSEETGRLVTNPSQMFKHYVRRPDGFIVDVVSSMPIEWANKCAKTFIKGWPRALTKYCFSLRLLRSVTLFVMVEKNKRDLTLNDWTRWLLVFVRQFILYFFFTAVTILMSSDYRMNLNENQNRINTTIVDALVWGYLSMFNLYAGVGLDIFPPTTLLEIAFYMVFSVYAVYEKGLLMGEVLSIINASLYVKSTKLYKIQLMENYFTARDMSPALKRKLTEYGSDLLLQYKLDVMPFFLRVAPYYIKVQIMQDLYMDYLKRCKVFHGITPSLLKQMSARLKRFIYFPGDTICQAGDVDSCMYFIHRGEVSKLDNDPLYSGLYYEVKIYTAGENFGIPQGLSRAVPHTNVYKAMSKSDVLSLHYYDWKDLRLAFPREAEVIAQRAKRLIESGTEDLDEDTLENVHF
ncbi:UNVERIFIED_CONTAM: hypothetical protein PYX00_004779 [Menopon gallinae]|uniref:Cyclic nucleotide-binding domain-containing protein n=1 Tax=Menopon gallinae TaxID=328185 RepID=A0AAW2I5K4_9NEOP